jgi:UDP-N-acetylmuramoyl-tripeptide--D-alanyl-D-alanine ligase
VAHSPMAAWTAGKIEHCTRGSLERGSRDCPVQGVSIDSRTIQPGDLFIAIRGPRHDGHAHVGSALDRGSAGVLVDGDGALPGSFPPDRFAIRVRETHQALKDLAGAHRLQWRGSLVAVTGSMGKTTTKEFCAQLLASSFRIYRSPGNLNNLFGLPLSLLRMGEEEAIGIFEMGMSAFGEIAEMCRIARPDIGIITNVAPVHLEFFRSLEGIARAKGELAECLPQDGTLIFNLDDPLVAGIAGGFKGNRFSFGTSPDADICAQEIEIVGRKETRFRLRLRGRCLAAAVPFAGPHYVLNALPAVALALRFGVDEERILADLPRMTGASMRGEVLTFSEGFTLIDDSYNSNPRALMSMIETLAGLAGDGRRLLVAGEMLELGPESESIHRECGAWAARSGVDIIIGVQGAARLIAAGAAQAGMPGENARFFETVEEASDCLAGIIRPGDSILVKGSRGVGLERVVRALRSRFCELVN